MTIPRSVASFNKRVTNRVTGPFARHLPGFAVVHHVGRRSARAYETPVNMFRRGDEYVFVLTYGSGADWVRNVEAAGGCDVETRGRTVPLVAPRRFTDPARQVVPRPVRAVLRALDVDEFVALRPAPQ
jgi:deazaflavin-dependent oxidoreductase (nitroreductase family)